MVRTRSNLGRQSRNARNIVSSRASQSDEQRANNTLAARNAMARGRALRIPAPRPYVPRTLKRAAFNYDANFNYVSHGKVSIGPISTVCTHCKAFKFKHEVSGLCCSNGQVKLPELNPPPEPLHNLITGGTPISKHFLANIQAYNSRFQMTSFGATNIIWDNFMTTFKKLPYPKSIFFIISNEFCERFNYYGMRTILVLYLTRELDYDDDTATVIFHTFSMLVYFLCIFGAIMSDSWLGKYKTILYLSLIYVCGSILISIGAIPTLPLPTITFTMIGLALIALGSGGIKPCVSAFGGDQFKLPEQAKQVATFFSLFYFSINSGALLSTTFTPILREDVHCFGETECYSLAFGVPAVLMAISIVIFIFGRSLYKTKPPAGNMFLLVSRTIGNAISTKCAEHKTNPREHWLDYADNKHDKQLIDDVKVLMRVLVLYLPLPIFWALYDQQGSRWTFQAIRMNGYMSGSWTIKPDQMQILSPLMILAFIPLFDFILYPALSVVGIRRPLQKLALGGILAALSFTISGMLEIELEKTAPILPVNHQAQLRIFNGETCEYHLATNIPGSQSFDIYSVDYYVIKEIPIPMESFELQYTIIAKGSNCFEFGSHSFIMHPRKAYSLFMSSRNPNIPLTWYEDFVDKPPKAKPLVRTLTNVQPGRNIKWVDKKKGTTQHEEPAYLYNLTELNAGNYIILVDDIETFKTYLEIGGVYTIIIDEVPDGESFVAKQVEVTAPNSINILWQIPQYVVLTLGEVMFSVTGLEFSYAQAPLSMKSVLQACWLLTVAVGNVIVIIVAEANIFESQANEFFLFAGLMFVDMFVFMFVAYYYKPNDTVAKSVISAGTKTKPEVLGYENKLEEYEK